MVMLSEFKLMDLVLLTDPPYGTNTDTSWLTSLHVQRGKPANLSDARLQGDDGNLDLNFLFGYKKRLIFGFPYIYDSKATGWLIWDKQPGIDGRKITAPVEMASTTLWKGFDVVRAMWGGYYRVDNEIRYEHPTQKPLRVFEKLIQKYIQDDDIIVDPFLGSGTILVVAKRFNRKAIGIEIEERYCEIAAKRIDAIHFADTHPEYKKEGFFF